MEFSVLTYKEHKFRIFEKLYNQDEYFMVLPIQKMFKQL